MTTIPFISLEINVDSLSRKQISHLLKGFYSLYKYHDYISYEMWLRNINSNKYPRSLMDNRKIIKSLAGDNLIFSIWAIPPWEKISSSWEIQHKLFYVCPLTSSSVSLRIISIISAYLGIPLKGSKSSLLKEIERHTNSKIQLSVHGHLNNYFDRN
jgi:hypothetical protein